MYLPPARGPRLLVAVEVCGKVGETPQPSLEERKPTHV